MERESNPMEALCRSGCGFYGNPSTDGLCSVCFKEALKKKQQPPATTPSPVSAPFVPAAPTPLAGAAPTVPSLPVQPQTHTDSKCLSYNAQKKSIMENDPNKKESKGKRIFKKGIRRNSKSSNINQNSEQIIGVSRSKSFENKRLSTGINDTAPLPKPDGTNENVDNNVAGQRKINKEDQEFKLPTIQDGPTHVEVRKIVEIQDNPKHNVVFGETTSASQKDAKLRISPKLLIKNERPSEAGTSKKNLKRKLEEDSGAGTSGASTGTSDNDADDKDPSKDKKKKNRCAVCRKKVGLTGFECRCGGLFCAVHRYSDKHECSFDYRELGAQEIRRNNPVVVSQKIHKI